jgi:hypothetical protein
VAKLPTQESLGGLPAIQNRPIATYDTTAIGRGAANLGQGIERVGAALDTIDAAQNQAQAFETERRFQEFKWDQQKGLDTQMRQVEPGQADGFADQWAQGYKQNAKDFFATVPDRLKPQFDERLFGVERDFYNSAATFARTEQKRYSLEQLNDTSSQYYSRASAGEPLDNIRNDYKTAIKLNPYLTPIEKDEEARNGFLGLEKAAIEGRLARGEDPVALLKDVKIQPRKSPIDTDLNPEVRAKPFDGSAEIPAAPKPLPFSASVNDAITAAANKHGVDPGLLATFAKIESGGKPGAQTGSYKGLFQLSNTEFRKHGGEGNIFDPAANADAAAAKLKTEADQFQEKYGRPPSPIDLYMIHQQGEAGYDAHMAMPDAPAWQNMASTGEGREKGTRWAKQAIWGNIPDDVKAQFPGGVDSVTSADFVKIWQNKLDHFGAPSAAATPKQEYDLGPYPHLDAKTRSALIYQITLAGHETALADMRDAEASLRRVGKAAVDDQGRTALDRAKTILTRNQYTKAKLGWDAAIAEHEAVSPIADMTATEAADHLDSLTPNLGMDDERYAIADRVQKKANDEWTRIAGLRDTDPALSVDKSPEVLEAKDKLKHLTQMWPAQQNAILIDARKAAQTRVGIPDFQQRVLTDAEAADLLRLPRHPDDPQIVQDAMKDAVERARERYGHYAGDALDSAISVHLKPKENRDAARFFSDTLRAENKPKPAAGDNSWGQYFTGWFGGASPPEMPGKNPLRTGAAQAPTKANPLPAQPSASSSAPLPNQAQIDWAASDPQNRQAAFDDKFGPGAFAKAMAGRQAGGAR